MTDISVTTARSLSIPRHDWRDQSATDALDIRSVTRLDKDRCEAAMTIAFSTDPVARWAWPDPLQYISTFMPLVTLFGGKSHDHGSAHVIGDFVGVAQWLPPGIQPDDEPIGELFRQNMVEPRLSEVLSLFEQMADFHPAEPHWYLPLIGIDPMFQGRGYGSRLMQHALVACDRDHQPAYLEATCPANRSLYERHGFRVLGEIISGDSPPLFPMLREAR